MCVCVCVSICLTRQLSLISDECESRHAQLQHEARRMESEISTFQRREHDNITRLRLVEEKELQIMDKDDVLLQQKLVLAAKSRELTRRNQQQQQGTAVTALVSSVDRDRVDAAAAASGPGSYRMQRGHTPLPPPPFAAAGRDHDHTVGNLRQHPSQFESHRVPKSNNPWDVNSTEAILKSAQRAMLDARNGVAKVSHMSLQTKSFLNKENDFINKIQSRQCINMLS